MTVKGVNWQAGNTEPPTSLSVFEIVSDGGKPIHQNAYGYRLMGSASCVFLPQGALCQPFNEDDQSLADAMARVRDVKSRRPDLKVVYGGGRVDPMNGFSTPPDKALLDQCDVYGLHMAAFADLSQVPLVTPASWTTSGKQLPVVITELEQDPLHLDWDRIIKIMKESPVDVLYFTWHWLGQDGTSNANINLDAHIEIVNQIMEPDVIQLPLSVPEEQQPTGSDLCWLQLTHAFYLSRGYSIDIMKLYQDVTNEAYTWPGQPADFIRMKKAIDLAAQQANCVVEPWIDTVSGTPQPNGCEGFVRRLEDVDQLLRDGTWLVACAVYMKDLVSGPTADYNNFQHWVGGIGFDSAGNVQIVDTFRTQDSGTDHYTVESFHQAIRDNFDPVWCAIAFKIPVVTQQMSPVEEKLHQIGIESYMMPQNEHTSRIQILVQQALTEGGWKV